MTALVGASAATLPNTANKPKSFATATIRGGDAAQHIRVPIAGWRELFLIVDNDGDYNHDVANWADARLIDRDGKELFLDTLEPASATQEWGKFKRDNKSAVGGPMQIAQKKFVRGLGTHAESVLHYKLTNDFAFFDAWVGVDASRKPGEGSVRFIVSPVLVAPSAGADLKQIDFEALRLAINDLSSTFRDKYPRRAEFLRRLEVLEKEWRVLVGDNSFPLTPALSPRERENRAPSFGASDTLGGIQKLDQLPLLPKGEGRGEGEENGSKSQRFASQFAELQREALLSNPLLDFDKLLVLKRETTTSARKALGGSLGVGDLNAHTSDTIPRQGQFRDELAVLSNLRGEPKFTTIHAPTNHETIIDPALDFGADRLLFAQNGAREKNWRVWEMKLDGTNPRQFTPDDGADIGHFDPCYLPDGRIIFASTASYQGLPCEFGSKAMTCLYLLDPRTRAVRQLTFEQDSDWCPTVLHNGRVMYLRWEYTDQSHANSRILFHMNPDGTDQREFRGSGSWFPGSFFYAKAIPGEAHQVIGVAGGHHGTPRSGRLLIMDPSQGRRDGEGIVQEIPGRGKRVEPIVRDRLVDGVWPQFLQPAPLSAKYHLVSAKLTANSLWGIYLVDVFDNITLIKEVEGAALLWPTPVQKRAQPPIIPDRVDPQTNESTVFIADVYAGPGLKGIPRGTVKKLRVVEYYFAKRGMGGLYGTLGADGPWDVKRILGTAPVDADGSASFVMPANTPVCVQPLDADNAALQLERSWFVGMPGERVSCIGCHESQDAVALNRNATAMRRAPSRLDDWFGPTRGFSFVREVQPVLDRYCVSCHDGRADAAPCLKGSESLTNWSTQLSGHWGGGGKFTKSYWELQRFVRRPGIEGDRRMFTPMDFHFSATELGQLLRKGHYGVTLDSESRERLTAWVDLNAPFYGTWGEIPQFTEGYGRMESKQLASATERSLELRKKYVPGGPFPDYEKIPATPKYDTTPVVPTETVRAAEPNLNCDGWPFDAASAIEKQLAVATSGKITRSVNLGDGVTLELVLVPGGRFIIGSTNGPADESPRSISEVKPFWMARFETSNRQFKQFDTSHESRTEDRHGYQFGAVGYDQDKPDQPAVRVSWEEAMAFCRWVSAKTGWQITLPTEAQWEWACRAGAATPFSFGELDADYSPFANVADKKLREFAADTSLDNYAAARPMKSPNPYDDWIPRDDRFDDGGFITEAVGKYKPNAWGIHDLHGNAWEWTLSAYRPYPYRDGDGRNAVEGSARDTERVVRGGSWFDRPFRCTASFRLPYRQYQRVYNVGFRVVCVGDSAATQTASR